MTIRRIGLALLALTTAASAFAGFAGTDLFLPSVGNRPGNSGSQWYTLLWIYNPSPTVANIRVWFLQRGLPNPSPLYFDDSIPAGGTNRYPDVITDKFHVSLWGALRITSPSEVVVTCRMYNLPPGGGDADTQGQDYAGVPASFAIGSGQSTELLGVYQTTPLASSVFRYSFGWVETTGGTANVRVTAYNEDGSIFTHKDYPTTLGYEPQYYDIADLIPNVNVTNVRLKVEVTGGSGKVVAVGSGVANSSNDGTTFEMQFADSLLGGGLSTVSHDGTLTGDGTTATPLGIADNGVSAVKIASGQVVKSLNGIMDNVTLGAGSNVTITPSGSTLTIAATPGGGGGSITGVTAGTGLTGGGTSGNVTVGIANGGVGNAQLAANAVDNSKIVDTAVTASKIYSGQVVKSLNGLHDTVTLGAGSNVTITPSGNTLTIATTAGTLPTGSAGQTLRSNGSAWLASSALANDGVNVGIANDLLLPSTGAGGTSGVIALGGNPFMHNYAKPGSQGGNTFVGQQAGDFTMGSSNSSDGSYNTAIGVVSLSSNTTGHGNTASGAFALQFNTTGFWNTATGVASLQFNTAGSYNTASGYSSLNANTTGSSNTASGFQSLSSNTTASQNTAVGAGALQTQSFSNSNTPWNSQNTAVGYQALFSNQPDSAFNGYRNTAIGDGSLQANTTGSGNTASGFAALWFNTTGFENTASGVASLNNNTTGSSNIALGSLAGANLTTGDHNIDIGNQGNAGEGNTIRIGDSNQTNTYIAGIHGVTIASGSAVLIDSAGHLGSVSSSLRFKQDMVDMGDASSRLMELRPVTFHYKTQPDGPLQYGLIAEEVNEVMPELVVKDAMGQPETVAYHELPAMLVNELQKQRATIQAEQAQIEALVARLAAIEARLAAK